MLRFQKKIVVDESEGKCEIINLDVSITDLVGKDDNHLIVKLSPIACICQLFSEGDIIYTRTASNKLYIYSILQIYSYTINETGFSQLCKIIFHESNIHPQCINAYLDMDFAIPRWKLQGELGIETLKNSFKCKVVFPDGPNFMSLIQKNLYLIKDCYTGLYILQENDENLEIDCLETNQVVYVIMNDFWLSREGQFLYKKWHNSLFSKSPEILMITNGENENSNGLEPIQETLLIEDSPLYSNSNQIRELVENATSKIDSAKNRVYKFCKKFILLLKNRTKLKSVTKELSIEVKNKTKEEFRFPKKHARKTLFTDSKIHDFFLIQNDFDGKMESKEDLKAEVETKSNNLSTKKRVSKKRVNVNMKINIKKTSSSSEENDGFILDILSEFNRQYSDLFEKSEISNPKKNEIYDKFKLLVEEMTLTSKDKGEIMLNIYNKILELYPELKIDVKSENNRDFAIILDKFRDLYGNLLNFIDKSKWKEVLKNFSTMKSVDFRKTIPLNIYRKIYFNNEKKGMTVFNIIAIKNILMQHIVPSSETIMDKKEFDDFKNDNVLNIYVFNLTYQSFCSNFIDSSNEELFSVKTVIFMHCINIIQLQIKLFLQQYQRIGLIKSGDINIDEEIQQLFETISLKSSKLVLYARILLCEFLKDLIDHKYLFLAVNLSRYLFLRIYDKETGEVVPDLEDEDSELSRTFIPNFKRQMSILSTGYDMAHPTGYDNANLD